MIPVLFYMPGACSFGSIVALEWLGQPFRLCRLDGEMVLSEAYRKINPLHQVPTYKSGEGTITESLAVLQHVGFLGLGKKIAYKQGTADFDHLNQMLSFLTTSLHPSMGPVHHADRYADHESSQDDIKHKTMKERVPGILKTIEDTLSRHKWLSGHQPTVADAYFYGVGRNAKKFIDLDKDFPKIADFFERFKTDPGVQFAQAIEDGKAPRASAGFKGEVSLNQLV